MLSLVAPLNINRNFVKISTPIILHSDRSVVVKLEPFDISEKEDLFNVSGLNIHDGNFTCKKSHMDLARLMEYSDYIVNDYKIVISSKKKAEPCELQDYQDKIDFILRILLCRSLPCAKIIKNGFISSGHIPRCRYSICLDNTLLKQIRSMAGILFSEPEKWKRIQPIRFFVNSAMAPHLGLDIAGAFYVIILESILIPNTSHSELRYKFSVRSAKLLKKNYGAIKTMQNYYDKRSRVLHGNNINIFTENEVLDLEKMAHMTIADQMLNDEKYTEESLNKMFFQ